jgi:phosphoribosyl 1,2-cyclic phosphate phosphodiesterase
MSRPPGQVKVTFLGTGTSHGVPMIGCECPVCTSDDPHDTRTRPSIIVEFGGRTILVDTGPELRIQCLERKITRVDAVLFTHAHADHVAGLDDLRSFNWLNRGVVNCYGTADTVGAIRGMFAYIFDEDPDYPSHKPSLELHTIDQQPFDLLGNRIVPIPLLHGTLPVLGYRFGDVAYCTDCSVIPPASMELLGGLDLLILDALRKRPHPTHFNLEQAVAVAARINARRTCFTHIAHELPHEGTNRSLPDGMALAYDGQVVVSDPGGRPD